MDQKNEAITPLEMGNLDQAAVPVRATIDVLLKAGTQTTGSDFLSFQLLLMQIDTLAAERQASQLPADAGAMPSQPKGP